MNAVTPITSQRPWHDTLAAQRLLQALVELNSLSVALNAERTNPQDIMTDAANAIGRIEQRWEDRGTVACSGTCIWTASGYAATEIWAALVKLRDEAIVLQMIAAGFERKWFDYASGEKLDRALALHERLTLSMETVSDALNRHLERRARVA